MVPGSHFSFRCHSLRIAVTYHNIVVNAKSGDVKVRDRMMGKWCGDGEVFDGWEWKMKGPSP